MTEMHKVFSLIDDFIDIEKAMHGDMHRDRAVSRAFRNELDHMYDAVLEFKTVCHALDKLQQRSKLCSPVNDTVRSLSRASAVLVTAMFLIKDWQRGNEMKRPKTLSMRTYAAYGKGNFEKHVDDLILSTDEIRDALRLIPYGTLETHGIVDGSVIKYLKEALMHSPSRWEPATLESELGVVNTDSASIPLRCCKDGRVIELFDSYKYATKVAWLLRKRQWAMTIDSPSAFIALPKCIGITPNDAFVFELPVVDGTRPRSLLAYLTESPTSYTLESRVAFALHLARAVLLMRSLRLWHNEIRTDTIFVMGNSKPDSDETIPSTLGLPCILGWGSARDAGEESDRAGDDPIGAVSHFEKMLYEPPTRGGALVKKMDMCNDIYSLGVCLLQLALWTPFRQESATGSSNPMLRDLERIHEVYKRDIHLSNDKVTSSLVNIACRWVPATMGSTFAEVVETCLTCWDDVPPVDDYEDAYKHRMFGWEVKEVEVSIHFSMRVVKALESICVG